MTVKTARQTTSALCTDEKAIGSANGRTPSRRWRSRGLRASLAIIGLLFLASCSAVPSARTTETLPPYAPEHALGWWRASFRMTWPEGDSPRWYMDALLAHRIIAPVLNENRARIHLWRFHRRAARDGAGHRFSFLFYSPAATARHVFQQLEQAPLLAELLSRERLIKVDFDDVAENRRPGIADTSDPHWPSMVQRTWPHFIMGASEMWLGLIRESANDIVQEENLSDDLLYRKVHDHLSALWKEQGQHPFLHHLNALFAYEEMIVIDRNGTAMRF